MPILHPILDRVYAYHGWTVSEPVIPKLYWDVYSQEERIKKMCIALHRLEEYCDYLGGETQLNRDTINALIDEFEKFKDTGFFDYYADQLEKWIEANMKWIFERFCKMVFFGLTKDGYFCAYIPDSWSDIVFDTGAIYGTYPYGRLILRYNVDGSGVIDNTGTKYNSHLSDLVKTLDDLEKRVAKNEKTLYTHLEELENA